MADGFTRNPAMVAHITGWLFLSRVASTKQWKKFRELLEARIVQLVLAVVSALMLRSEVAAQTFTTLYNFKEPVVSVRDTNTDGSYPYGSLLLSDNTLYGTTVMGGSGGTGTIFKLNTDGTGFSVLYSFTPVDSQGANSDGNLLYSGLILSGSTLCGEALVGGYTRYGTVFALNTDGTGFTVLQTFNGMDESSGPSGGLVQSGNTLYGTAAASGGYSDFPRDGTVFALASDGSEFRNLHVFTNIDGSRPVAGVILCSNTLYGTTSHGGISDYGTVFALNLDSGGFKVLHRFVDSEGINPVGGLVSSGNDLYGTTYSGGSSGNGTIFRVHVDGSGFTNLYSFSSFKGFFTNSGAFVGLGTNEDGANPTASLVLSGNTLYGTAFNGGGFGNGAVFAISTEGTGFTTLHGFSAAGISSNSYTNTDGAFPQAALILSGNTLYGTATTGGASGNGTVFSFSLPVKMKPAIAMFGQELVLTWPTNVTGSLQATTNLVAPVWTGVSRAPVVVNGQNTLTNPISGTQQFFRLSQ